MTRETLQSILRAGAGVQEKSNVFKATADQRVTFYLGGDGRGLVVSQVEEVRLEDAFVALKTQEPGQIFTEYPAIYALSLQPPKEGAPKKAGFA